MKVKQHYHYYHNVPYIGTTFVKNETRMDGGDLVKNVCDEFMRPNLNLERLFFRNTEEDRRTLHTS